MFSDNFDTFYVHWKFRLICALYGTQTCRIPLVQVLHKREIALRTLQIQCCSKVPMEHQQVPWHTPFGHLTPFECQSASSKQSGNKTQQIPCEFHFTRIGN